jgi:hypothetical protein
MPLGDSFPDKFKEEFSERNIKVGCVIKVTDVDSKPEPKEKRFIIIAETLDSYALGALYVNSEINVNVLRTEKLRRLQVEFSAKSRNYLEWDSWIDCSKIKPFSKEAIMKFIKQNPEKHLGKISEEDLRLLLSTVKGAATLDLTQRKKWGLL